MDSGNGLPNCWEIERCGRERGGHNESNYGECPVSQEGMGHSCWAVPGTVCGGKIQGLLAEKIGQCSSCTVYKFYNRSTGTRVAEVIAQFPEEEEKYRSFMSKRIRNR